MKKMICLAAFVLLACQGSQVLAHREYVDVMKERYDLKLVSCFACHAKKTDLPEELHEAYRENSKSFLNGYGKELQKLLDETNHTERLAEVEELDRDAPERLKVQESVSKEFLEILDEAEKVKATDEKTYGDLLNDGELDGVRPN